MDTGWRAQALQANSHEEFGRYFERYIRFHTILHYKKTRVFGVVLGKRVMPSPMSLCSAKNDDKFVDFIGRRVKHVIPIGTTWRCQEG
jgi:hypothetical protein